METVDYIYGKNLKSLMKTMNPDSQVDYSSNLLFAKIIEM